MSTKDLAIVVIAENLVSDRDFVLRMAKDKDLSRQDLTDRQIDRQTDTMDVTLSNKSCLKKI